MSLLHNLLSKSAPDAPNPPTTGVRSINVRADRILPGDVILRPQDGGTVRMTTVVRTFPEGNDTRIVYKTAATQRCRPNTIFTVLRAV